MTNEIAIRGIDDAARISKALAASGFYKDVNTAEKAMVKVMAGIELGITPLAAMTGIHIVDGKVTLGSGLVGSQIKRSGKYTYKIVEMTDKRCELMFLERNDENKFEALNPNAVFTMEDAKKAGLTGKANWSKYPDAMLFARAITKGARMHCPEVFGGPIYTPEEMGDDNATKTIDVPIVEVVETTTTPPVATPKIETPVEQPKPKREIMSQEQSKELQRLSESLAFTSKRRNEIREAGATLDKNEAHNEIQRLKMEIMGIEEKGVSEGQKEYARKIVADAATLLTEDEGTKIIAAIDSAADFKTANEKIVKNMAAINTRKEKAAKPAAEKQKDKQKTTVLTTIVLDGPSDDEGEN